MNTIDCIKTRRSRRLFLNKEVPEEKINKILECGIAAPSSVDCQPWHFVIVKDRDKLKKLAELKKRDGYKHILTAPLSIIICIDTEKSPSRYIEDGICATQNILLAAHDLRLGSVYISGCKSSEPRIAEKIREILSLPEKIMPITILPTGYPDSSEKLDKKSLLSLKNIIHYNKW